MRLLMALYAIGWLLAVVVFGGEVYGTPLTVISAALVGGCGAGMLLVAQGRGHPRDPAKE